MPPTLPSRIGLFSPRTNREKHGNIAHILIKEIPGIDKTEETPRGVTMGKMLTTVKQIGTDLLNVLEYLNQYSYILHNVLDLKVDGNKALHSLRAAYLFTQQFMKKVNAFQQHHMNTS